MRRLAVRFEGEDKKIRIGHFVTQFPYRDKAGVVQSSEPHGLGGGELVAYHLAINMARRGHKVTVITTSVDTKDCTERYESLEVYRYGTFLRHRKAALSLRMFRDSLNFGLDVIHAHFTTPAAELAAARCARKIGAPFLVTYHGDWVPVGGFIRRTAIAFYNRYFLHKVLSQAKRIVCSSAYYIDESKFLPRYRDRIVCIPNGINLEEFAIPHSKDDCRVMLGLASDSKVILFVGNLFPYKAPDVLIKAMPEIAGSIRNVMLILAGKGILEEKLKELSRNLGVEKYIRFPGYVSGELKSVCYKAADVFVLPSTMGTEVFPLVLLEASASGLPVVVSDLAAFKCIIREGANGIVVKRNDEHNLAEAIIYLLQNDDVRKRMGQEGRRRAECYSWDTIAAELEGVYQEVLRS